MLLGAMRGARKKSAGHRSVARKKYAPVRVSSGKEKTSNWREPEREREEGEREVRKQSSLLSEGEQQRKSSERRIVPAVGRRYQAGEKGEVYG